MTSVGFLQVGLLLFTLLIIVVPLGRYMRLVYDGSIYQSSSLGSAIERFIYRLSRINVEKDMNWKEYLLAMLCFNLLGILIVYIIQRCQFYLPLNPQHFSAPSYHLAFNTAVSFVTNTDWQSYSGETTLSYCTQMLALTTQNFLSAATGMSLLVALIRGITRNSQVTLGNFWVDTLRGVIYILLPLSLILSLVLVSQGVIQNVKPTMEVSTLQGFKDSSSLHVKQMISMGPVASQIAIKQLGSNGGGFFNVNAAHPFENPTPITNFLEMLAMIMIPAAFCTMFGAMVGDRRQGWAILLAMLIIFVPFTFMSIMSEQAGNIQFNPFDIDQTAKKNVFPGGNMEGKETRFGIVGSALWAVSTTATSNGSVNSMLDSYTPIGGLVSLCLMQLGEVVFGGVGSGLYGILMFVIVTVFVAGLMVGRTPEYLGKKIEPFEMKMASITVLVMPVIVLFSSALSSVIGAGVQSISIPGPHGLSEILYAFSSMGNNNGSAFAGLNANTPYYNLLGGLVMLIGRYWIAIPVLAIAGSLVRKKIAPKTAGTLDTHSFVFIILLVCVIFLIGALSFFPVLALGPIVEQLHLWRVYE